MDDGDSPFDSVNPDDFVVHPERSVYRTWWSLFGAAVFMGLAGLAGLMARNPFWWIALAIALIILVNAIVRYPRPSKR